MKNRRNRSLGARTCANTTKFLVGRGFCPAAELLLGVCDFSKGPFAPQSASMLQTGKPAGKPAAAWKGCPTRNLSRGTNGRTTGFSEERLADPGTRLKPHVH